MNEPAEPDPNRFARRFQFSIGSMLLWMAVVCLAVTNMWTQWELSTVKRELASQQPLPAEEVARQFQQKTTLGPITVKVRDVRYSPESDSYKVAFSWTDKTTNKTWSTDVKLTSDGYGTYFGQIRNDPFITPLGFKESFTVAVETPSPLLNSR